MQSGMVKHLRLEGPPRRTGEPLGPTGQFVSLPCDPDGIFVDGGPDLCPLTGRASGGLCPSVGGRGVA